MKIGEFEGTGYPLGVPSRKILSHIASVCGTAARISNKEIIDFAANAHF
jgi:hypothetical protein